MNEHAVTQAAVIEVEVTLQGDCFRFAGAGPFTSELRCAFKDWLDAVTGQAAALDALADTLDGEQTKLATARDASTVPE